MIYRIKRLLSEGFFHILGSTFVNKCIAFLTNIFLVRILTKSEYGIFTGTFNAFYIVFLFSGLGITSGILYFCSKEITVEEKGEYYWFSVKFGFFSEVILSLSLTLYGALGNVGIEEIRGYIVSLAGLPFLAFMFDYFITILRAEKNNIMYSYLSNINSLLYAIFSVSGAYIDGIKGTIIGRYLAYISVSILGAKYCKKYIVKPSKRLMNEKKRDITKYSLKAGVSNALNLLLYRLDVAIITIVVADTAALASYKTGTALPENVNFIPQCIMIYYLPLFIQNLKNVSWIKRKVKEIYFLVGTISFLIGIIMVIFPTQIIMILWGEEYLDAVECMRVLSVSFILLSTFRTTSINILLALKRVGYTMFVSIVTGLLNIILDINMTVRYGSIGAAYATLIVAVIAAILSFPYVLYIIYSGKEVYEN